jgi:lysophospholipase L1-like esterase
VQASARLVAFALGLLAALVMALATNAFALRAVPGAANPFILNFAVLVLAVGYARVEPRLLARWFGSDQSALRRRLWLDLAPLLALFLLRDVLWRGSDLARLWLPAAIGLRAVSVWATRRDGGSPSVGWGAVLLAAAFLAALFGGSDGYRDLFPVVVALVVGAIFLRGARRLLATEGIAAIPGVLGLSAYAATGDRWFGVAALAGWGIGRLYAYPRWLDRRGYGAAMLLLAAVGLWGAELGLVDSPLADALESRHLSNEVRPHDTLFWIHKEVYRGGTDFGVGRVGIRGREDVPAKDPGIKRVLCCGGSTTFGVDLPVDQVWVAEAEQLLTVGGRRIELLNAGEPGYTTFQIGLLLRHYLIPDYDPDGVILYLGYNDSQLSRGPYTERELYAMWQAQQAGEGTAAMRLGRLLQGSRLYNLYAHVLTGARRRWHPTSVPLSTSEEFSTTLGELLGELRAAGIRTLVAAEAHQNEDVLYRRVMERLAAEYGAGFVDVYDRVRRNHSPAEVHSDVVHLTPAGNRIVAGIIAEAWRTMEAKP